MPVMAVKRGDKWRIVETATKKIARNAEGTPVDGGGHSSPSEASAQARAINANIKD